MLLEKSNTDPKTAFNRDGETLLTAAIEMLDTRRGLKGNHNLDNDGTATDDGGASIDDDDSSDGDGYDVMDLDEVAQLTEDAAVPLERLQASHALLPPHDAVGDAGGSGSSVYEDSAAINQLMPMLRFLVERLGIDVNRIDIFPRGHVLPRGMVIMQDDIQDDMEDPHGPRVMRVSHAIPLPRRFTPLMMAAAKGFPTCVGYLLQHGADVNIAVGYG